MSTMRETAVKYLRNPISERALVLIGLGGLFYFLFGITFHAQFHLTDDHQIIEIAPALKNLSPAYFWNIGFEAGRLRHFYYLFHIAEIVLLGTNPQAWHIATSGLGVLTCLLFYMAARKLGADIISSTLFILMLFVVNTGQMNIWFALGPAETVGMLLTGIATWATVNAARRGRQNSGWDWLALMAMAMAGLTKESFILVIPALLLLRWTLQCWFSKEGWLPALRKLVLPLTAGLLVFIAEMSIVLSIISSLPDSYGPSKAALGLSSFDPQNWYQLLTSSEFVKIGQYIPFSLLILVLLWYWPGQASKHPYILASSLISMGWVIPQLVLYSKYIGAHYFWPAIVGVVAINVLGLAILRRMRIWVLFIVFIVWLSLPLLGGLETAKQEASTYTANTLALHKMITYLTENTAPNQSIVIMADPALNYERIYSLRVHLQFAGSKSPVYLLPILPKQGYTSEWLQSLAEGITAMFPDLSTLDPEHIGNVIVLTSPDDFSNIPWLAASLWQEKTFSEPYSSYSLSLQKLGYEQAGYISYNILTPGEALLSFPPDYPLVTIDASLKGKVGIGLVKTARWGIENQDGGLLWLGHGEEEGLGIRLWAAQKQAVQAIFQAQPGPARADKRRTVEVTVQNQAGTQNAHRQFDQATELTFSAELQPGWNDVRIAVLDKATIFKQPNGDTRPLLVLLRHITVTSLSTK